MGSTTPTDAANYNYTKRDDALHSLKFAGMPDAAECYAKFKSGGSFNGRLQFIIHGDINYCDPETSNSQQNSSTDYKVASAAILIPACTEWTKFTAEFQYTGNDKTPDVHYMLASATTNPTPGGSKDDELCLDDVKLIYYHSLSSCTYNGRDVQFDESNSATVSELYDAAKLSYEKKGVGATVEESYNQTTGVLTIAVKGNDYEADNSSITTYTIRFAKPEDVKDSKDYTEELYVIVDGATTDPQSTTVTVQTRYDGKINFLLKNFKLVSGEDALPVGNIEVLGLEKNGDEFSCQDIITIPAGDDLGFAEDEWLGPMLGEVPLDLRGKFVGENNLKVSIDIDMTDTDLGQYINVHLGYTPTTANMTVKAGKYGTFYAPFEVTLPTDVVAYTCESLKENDTMLTLTEVTGGKIPAGTPVIVAVTTNEALTQEFSGFDVKETAGPVNFGLLYGVATGGTAPEGSYVLQTQGDDVQRFYQVKAAGGLTVPANRCYLQLPASSGVKAISFPSDPTAIDGVKELLSGKAEIYDLEGRRLPALQKGINIVGGKKVMVK